MYPQMPPDDFMYPEMPLDDMKETVFSGTRIIYYNKKTGYYSCELPDGAVVDVDKYGNYFDDEGNPVKVDGWNELVREYKNNEILKVLSDSNPQDDTNNPNTQGDTNNPNTQGDTNNPNTQGDETLTGTQITSNTEYLGPYGRRYTP